MIAAEYRPLLYHSAPFLADNKVTKNIKEIGKFQDESPYEVIECFVGIRSKCYSFKTKNNVVQKAKGVSKVVVKKNIRGIAVSRKRLGDCDGPMAV